MKKDKIKFPLVKPLPHDSFDSDAMRVYRRLCSFHHTTYFVGGCIRDLLLRKIPKDFDIVTSARPNQVKNIFRNSRLIGRRFRLVNVFFGSKIIEVTTFRRTPWRNGEPNDPEYMLLHRDNVFGTDEEDARRRDFTINALFYSPQERTVIDYVNGMEDLQMGKVRAIGDPEIRFCEDPVRIIRALKLQACLNFEIVPETRAAIQKHVFKLSQSASPRILLEMEKILRSGTSLNCFDVMAHASIFSIIAPDLHNAWHANGGDNQWLYDTLQGLDRLSFKKRQGISRAVLLAGICFPIIIDKWKTRSHKKPPGDLFCKQNLGPLVTDLSISRKLLDKISQIIRAQFYFDKNCGKRNGYRRILKSSYFPEALDFLYIRSRNVKESRSVYKFWKQLALSPKR